MNLKNAKALVTGGSEGIGRAIAASLRAEGADVAITGRRRELLEAAALELGAQALVGDVACETDVKRSVAAFLEQQGRIDILVNNAGVGYFAPLAEIDLQRFNELFAINVTGAMLMAREVAPHFIHQKSGHLINISSTSGLSGGAGSTAYSGSKFALKGMTECWRAELRRHNVRVMLVNPSEVLTGFAAKLGRAQQASEQKLRSEEIATAVIGALKLDERGFIPEFSVFATNPF